MKSLVFFACLFFAVSGAFAQNPKVVGKIFPEISGETLTDKPINIPNDTKGKFTIVGMAYSRDAEADLKTWLNPAYNKFIAKTGMFDMEIDVNLYFIPMFTGTNIPVAGQAKKKMKEDTSKEFYPHVIFYKGELKTYKKELEFDNRDTGYFFVLDKEGKIVYATSGKFAQKKLDAIEDILLGQ
jgi:hypothetical protein